MNIRIGLVLAWLAILPALAGAQTHLSPGERVRLHGPDGTVTIGVLTAASAERVQLAPTAGGPDLILGLSEIDRLERSLGEQPEFFRNFLLGVGITAVGGGLIWAVAWSPCTETGWFACFLEPTTRSEAFTWGVLAGGIIGLPVGLLAGALIRSERWEELPLYGREVAIAIRPIVGDDVGLSVAVPLGGR